MPLLSVLDPAFEIDHTGSAFSFHGLAGPITDAVQVGGFDVTKLDVDLSSNPSISDNMQFFRVATQNPGGVHLPHGANKPDGNTIAIEFSKVHAVLNDSGAVAMSFDPDPDATRQSNLYHILHSSSLTMDLMRTLRM